MIFSATIILATLISTSTLYIQNIERELPEDFLFGVSYGSNAVDEAKLKSIISFYLRFFVVIIVLYLSVKLFVGQVFCPKERMDCQLTL